MITIVDYGMGNLRSVTNALKSLGAAAELTSDPAKIAAAEKLILPGVGAFGAAMRELRARRLIEPIRAHVAAGKPYLGICLGLQLLFDSSEEAPEEKGLGLFRGTVRRFPDQPGLKIPHMGWNAVSRPKSAGSSKASGGKPCPLLEETKDGSHFYFVHSFYARPEDGALTSLESDYGVRFTAMLWQGAVFATQFHPEKSQSMGLALLKRFAALPRAMGAG